MNRLLRNEVSFAGIPKNSSRYFSEIGKDKGILYSNLWSNVAKISGRFPRNYQYAGKTFIFKGNTEWIKKNPVKAAALFKKYPNGVKFNSKGFPIFTPYSKKNVKINMRGNRTTDFTAANKKAGYSRTPLGYTWHHHEDGETMQLIPFDIHDAVKHTGGVAIIKSN